MSGQLVQTDEQLCTAKILIIDDEEAYTKVLEWVLKQSKFPNFKSVNNAEQALEAFKQFQPDLVLLDLFMPVIDGFTLLKQFRELIPAGEYLPVLALTGVNTSDTRKQALEAGATDFLGKPVDYMEVILRIKNLLLTRFLYQQARQLQGQSKPGGK